MPEDVILKVVDKFLMELEVQLQEKKVEVRFSNELKKYLVKNGFDPLMGARPMSRLIQDKIKKSLADEICLVNYQMGVVFLLMSTMREK